MTSNNPPVLVELTPELAEFLLNNCDANMRMGLLGLQSLTNRDLAEQMVTMIENFKTLKKAVERGQEERKQTTAKNTESPEG